MLTVSQYQRGLAHCYGCRRGEIDGKTGGPSNKESSAEVPEAPRVSAGRSTRTQNKCCSGIGCDADSRENNRGRRAGRRMRSLPPWQPSKQSRKSPALVQDGISPQNAGADITVTDTSTRFRRIFPARIFAKAEFRCKCGGSLLLNVATQQAIHLRSC